MKKQTKFSAWNGKTYAPIYSQENHPYASIHTKGVIIGAVSSGFNRLCLYLDSKPARIDYDPYLDSFTILSPDMAELYPKPYHILSSSQGATTVWQNKEIKS